MTDILYEFEQHYREKRAIWRMFEVAPFKLALARGRIFRWFGIHIPMELLGMQGDIDLMMSLLAPPQQNFTQLYETWEIKTTLLSKDGRLRSSKSSPSKQKQLLGQMKKYRGIGSPCHGLLELFIYEDQTMEEHGGPTREAMHLMLERAEILLPDRFGYRVIHFEHDRNDESRGFRPNFLGLKVHIFPPPVSSPTPVVLGPMTTPMAAPLSELANLLEAFVKSEIASRRIAYGNCVVTYCYDCRRLLAISPKGKYSCPHCNADLTLQIG